jgi:hypothetical protein
MSGYPLRSRLTKRGTTKADDASPPHSSVHSVASRSHLPFGRGGIASDPNTTRRGGRGDNSNSGRGGGIDRSRIAPRREHGVTVPRFPRTRHDVEEKGEDDESENIPALEDPPNEEDAVPTIVDNNKDTPLAGLDVFQAFKLPFALATQPEEECVFQQLDDGFDLTEIIQNDDPKAPEPPTKQPSLMDDPERITVHYTPEYHSYRAKPVDITGFNGIHFVLNKFGFKLSDSELLFLQSIDVIDVPSLLDICSLEPRPLYEHMRTNPHILDEHQDDLGATFDSRFVYFYSILSGTYAYLRDCYGVPTDSRGYFSGSFNLAHIPGGADATAYLESRGPALEQELQQIPFFLQYFRFCETNGHCPLAKYHELLRAPAMPVTKRVEKLKVQPTTVLTRRQVITSDGQLRYVEDAHHDHLDTRSRYLTAVNNARDELASGKHPNDPLVDNPTVHIPVGDGMRYKDSNPLRAQSWVSNGVRDARAMHGHPQRRQNIQLSVAWDGTEAKFRAYSLNLRGWMSQNNMGYLTDTNLVAAYKKFKTWEGSKYALAQRYTVTDAQFLADNEALFGAILQTAQGHAQRYITMYEATKDGLALWTRLNERFNGLQFPEETLHRLSRRLLQPYTDSHKGGLVGFVEDFLSIQAEMKMVDPAYVYHTKQSARQQILTLMDHFRDTDYDAIFYQFYQQMEKDQDWNLDTFTGRIFHYAARLDNHGICRSSARAHLAETQPPVFRTKPSQAYTVTGQSPAGATTNRPPFRKFLFLSREDHQLLREQQPELLARLQDFRQEILTALREHRHGSSNPTAPAPVTAAGGLPAQYPTTRANHTHSENEIGQQYNDRGFAYGDFEDQQTSSYDYTDDESWESYEQTSLVKAAHAVLEAQARQNAASRNQYRHGNTLRTLRIDIPRDILTFHTYHTNEYTSIVDGGADTMVLGYGWKFLETYTERKVNIVGFDENVTKKYGCPIGTACAVMPDVNGIEYLVIAYEAVWNKSSRTSLLSESQMRHNGLIVDSTSRKHTGIHGIPGTQSIFSPDKEIQFRMVQRDTLMVVPHRTPTETEITSLPRFELTSKAIWSPEMYHDDQASDGIDTHHFVAEEETHTCHLHNIPRCPTRYVIHRSDESSITSSDLTDMPQSYDFDISLFPEFGIAQEDFLTVETVIEDAGEEEGLPREGVTR